MQRYVISRLAESLVVLLGVSAVVFLILHLSGDPAVLLAPVEASAEQIERLRERLGLKDPLLLQYVRFLKGALRGDFGQSLRFSQPALHLVAERLPMTLQLALCAMAFAVAVAIPAGLVAAVYRNSAADLLVRAAALLGQAVPSFWLALMLILLFSLSLGWLPSHGYGSFRHLVMPILTVGSFSAASLSRLTRSATLEVLGSDYVRTARAKGLPERRVVFRHALRSALLPVVTVIGMEMAALMGGAVITETVFGLPGVGRLAVEAIAARDYPLVQACVFVAASAIVLMNLAVDLLYCLLDPRVRYE